MSFDLFLLDFFTVTFWLSGAWSHMAQAGLELPKSPKMTLNSRSCLYLPSAGVIGVHYHTRRIQC